MLADVGREKKKKWQVKKWSVDWIDDDDDEMNKKRDDVRYLLIKKYDVGLPDAIRRQAQNVDTAVIRHVPLQLIVLPSLVIKKETVWNESVQSR